MHRPAVGSWDGAVSYERGTPVNVSFGGPIFTEEGLGGAMVGERGTEADLTRKQICFQPAFCSDVLGGLFVGESASRLREQIAALT